jgi:hypothetical protein
MRYFYVQLDYVNGEFEYSIPYLDTSTDPTVTPEEVALNMARSEWGDPEPDGDDGFTFFGGEVACRWIRADEISQATYELLKEFI